MPTKLAGARVDAVTSNTTVTPSAATPAPAPAPARPPLMQRLDERIKTRLGGMFNQGHGKVLSACAWSAHHLLTGSYDGSAKLWDVVTGLCVHTLQHDPAKAVTTVALSETTCFTGGVRTVKVWSDETGALLSTFVAAPADGGEVKALAVSPKHGEPRVVAIALILPDGYRGCNILVCDVVDVCAGALALRAVVIQPHGTKNCWCVRWSFDERWLLSSGADKTTKVWEVAKLPAAVTRDGGGAAASEGIEACSVASDFHSEDVWCCCFAATAEGFDVGGVFTGSGDGTAARWATGATRPMTVYRGHVRFRMSSLLRVRHCRCNSIILLTSRSVVPNVILLYWHCRRYRRHHVTKLSVMPNDPFWPAWRRPSTSARSI